MTCPRCHESLPVGTVWCTNCEFQQVVPKLYPIPPGPRRPVVSGTPVPTHTESTRGGRLAWLGAAAAVVLTIGGMVLFSDDPRDRSTMSTADTSPAYWAPSATPSPAPTATAQDEAPAAAEPRKRKKPAPAPSGSATPGPSPTATPTETPSPTAASPTPSVTPSPTRAPQPRDPRTASPQPKPQPKPPATKKPTPAPQPTPTQPPGTPTPAPQPPATPTPAPPPPPATPTPQPAPRTAEEIARDLPAGMNCWSLKSGGHSYEVAYAYWTRVGRPWAFWDSDRDGRICEGIY